MKEADYILTTDLRSIRIAKLALHDVVSANNPCVPEAEYQQVMAHLIRWEARIYLQVGAESLE